MQIWSSSRNLTKLSDLPLREAKLEPYDMEPRSAGAVIALHDVIFTYYTTKRLVLTSRRSPYYYNNQGIYIRINSIPPTSTLKINALPLYRRPSPHPNPKQPSLFIQDTPLIRNGHHLATMEDLLPTNTRRIPRYLQQGRFSLD